MNEAKLHIGGLGEKVWILHSVGGRGKDGNLFYSHNATVLFSKYLADQTKTRFLNINSNQKSTFQDFKCVAVQGGEWTDQRNVPHSPAADVRLTTERGAQHWLLGEATQLGPVPTAGNPVPSHALGSSRWQQTTRRAVFS